MESGRFFSIFRNNGIENVYPRFLGDGNGFWRITCLLPYSTDFTPEPDFPSCRIGAFARDNSYRDLTERLKRVVRELRGDDGFSKSLFTIYCNSNRIDEKCSAAASGAGFLGKSTLLVTERFGPRTVVGILDSPVGPEGFSVEDDSGRLETGKHCGSCTACVEACPSGAILPEGGLILERCLQYYASRDIPMPENLMPLLGNRLYGCDECSIVCPRGTFTEGQAVTLGRNGPGEWLSIAFLLDSNDETLDLSFKGTALGLGFIAKNALRRNALIAAGNGRYPELRPLVGRYSRNENAALESAASYALTLKNPER